MSSNKTQHHGLHLWAAGDSFLRTEFNENNSMIDDALCWKRLGTATADGTSSLLSATVDGEELLLCGKIELSVFCPERAALRLTVNGETSGYGEVHEFWNQNQAAHSSGDLGRIVDLDSRCVWGIKLFPPLRGEKVCSKQTYLYFDATSCGQYLHAYKAPVNWEDVTSFDLRYQGNGTVPEGTRITVYGLRA